MGDFKFKNGSFKATLTYSGNQVYNVGINLNDGDMSFIYIHKNDTCITKIDKATANWTAKTTIIDSKSVVYYTTNILTTPDGEKIVFQYYPFNREDPYFRIDWENPPLSSNFKEIGNYSSNYLNIDLTYTVGPSTLFYRVLLIIGITILVILFFAYIYNIKNGVTYN